MAEMPPFLLYFFDAYFAVALSDDDIQRLFFVLDFNDSADIDVAEFTWFLLSAPYTIVPGLREARKDRHESMKSEEEMKHTPRDLGRMPRGALLKKRRRVEDEIAELKKKQLQKERDLQFVIDEMALLDADSSVLTAAPLPFAACANVMSRVSAAARAARQRVAERERAQDQAAEPEVENLQAAECGCFRMSMEV